MPKLGVDIGGVIIDRVDDRADTSFFGDNYLSTPPVPGVISALKAINGSGEFKDNVWLVSKCGSAVQARTLEWLAHHNFAAQTGIDPEHSFFTPTRIGKLAIAEELGLTHFVDDRLEVLSYLVEAVPNLYLFNPDEGEVASHSQALENVTTVNNWQELQLILGRTTLGSHESR